MIHLKEALIGKKNVDNANSAENQTRYVVFPFKGDGHTLAGKIPRIKGVGWDIYILVENDFYRIYGKSPRDVWFKEYSNDTIVWSTECTPRQIENDFRKFSKESLGNIFIEMSKNPNYYQQK